jgi:phosphoribosylanthranilate isomerase
MKPGVRTKICGLTRPEDALLAASCGADYLGLIFAPSLRRLEPAQAARIVAALRGAPPLEGPRVVGVFVNASAAQMRRVARRVGLAMLQLHGDEPPETCAALELPVIKALRLRDRGIFAQVRRYPTPFILLEPFLPGSYGGTGARADWSLAAEVVRAFPGKRFFLAGGLGPDNVVAAAAQVRPFAVDASSALEVSPGCKDPQRIREFLRLMREL